MERVLVTGGAGYIGSHVVRELKQKGFEPVLLDDLSSGFKNFVPANSVFANLSTADDARQLERVLKPLRISSVIHLAGFKYAGVSVQQPLRAFKSNVAGFINLLEVMENLGITRLVNSSSAAVYGQPLSDELITEDSPLLPLSPYGESKLMSEQILQSIKVSNPVFTYTNLRYFNVVGSGYSDLFDASKHNLFPIVLDSLARGITPQINGVDYPTEDGTCVRDYVHVSDLARAHVIALEKLLASVELEPSYNLGSGVGTSVREIMNAAKNVTGIDFHPIEAPRRPGDPARLVASSQKAARDLAWVNTFTVEEMMESAWKAQLQRSR